MKYVSDQRETNNYCYGKVNLILLSCRTLKICLHNDVTDYISERLHKKKKIAKDFIYLFFQL